MPLWYILREQYVVLTRYWTTWHWLWKICLSNNKSIMQHVRVCTLHACLKTSDLGIFVLSVRILVDGYLLLAVFRMFFWWYIFVCQTLFTILNNLCHLQIVLYLHFLTDWRHQYWKKNGWWGKRGWNRRRGHWILVLFGVCVPVLLLSNALVLYWVGPLSDLNSLSLDPYLC